MKKFLIAILFMIPLIVVAAIQGTGAAIIAWAPSVNAESIEIRNEYNEYIGGSGKVVVPRFSKDGSDGFVYIYINVYPKVTYSDEVLFKNSDEEGYDGDCVIERVEKTKYKLIAKENGNVMMKVYSVTNDNAYKTMNIYVTSEVITDMSIYALYDDGAVKLNEGDIINLSDKLKLNAYATPIEAIGENIIVWDSEKPEIVSVDKNGLIKPVGIGTTRIRATVTDKTGKEHFTFIYVNTNTTIFLRENEINLDREYFESLSSQMRVTFLMNNIIVMGEDSQFTPEDLVCISSGDNSFVYSIAGKELIINLIEDNEIVFKSDYIRDVYIENGGYYLEVGYADYRRSDQPNIRFEVSDTDILTVQNGKIMPKKEGACLICAVDTITGARTQNLSINVKKRIASFQLSYTNFDNLRGIKQERVWAMNWYNENYELTNVFKLDYDIKSVHPDTSYLDIDWSVNNKEYAGIDQNGNIIFYPACIGKDVTVTAIILVHGIKTDLRRSYTFKMAKEESTVNIYNFDQFLRANSAEGGKRATALQTGFDMQWPGSISVNNSLYGNGYYFNFSIIDDDGKSYDNALSVHKDNINSEIESITLENFSVQCAANYNDGKNLNNAINFENMIIPSYLKYVISRYCWASSSYVNNKSVATVEGCILGNAGLCAIYITDEYKDAEAERGTIVIKNCVFRETGCASIVTLPFNMDVKNNNQNYLPHIIFEGFIDSYNWMKDDELEVILNSFDINNFGDLAPFVNVLSKYMGTIMEGVMSEPQNTRMVYVDGEGERWVCMGMFAYGLTSYIDPAMFDTSDSEELVIFPISLAAASDFLNLIGVDINISNPCYFLSYQFDENNGPAIRPKDDCPENEVLFERLNSGN